MASTTATQLASNRRKSRLAAHNNLRVGPGGGSSGKFPVGGAARSITESSSPTPSPTLTNGSESNDGSGASASPTAELSNASSVSTSLSAARRRLLGAKSQQQQQTPSTGPPYTSRGRSRGSRARGGRRRGAVGEEDQTMTDEETETSAGGGAESDSNKLALNLHVAESVDSDDNGTCFNSVGTNTPRQTSPRHAIVRHHAQDKQQQQPYQPNLHSDETESSSNNNNNNRLLLPSAKIKQSRRHKNPLSPLNENSAKGGGGGGRGSFPPDNDELLLGRKNRDFDSIWDHPEEMGVSTTTTNNHSSNRSSNRNNLNNDNNPRANRDNTSTYSEFDHDHSVVGSRSSSKNAKSNNRGGGSVAQQQLNRILGGRNASARRNTGIGGGGGASIESSSKYGERGGGGNNSVESSRYGGEADMAMIVGSGGTRGGSMAAAGNANENGGEGDDDNMLNRPNVRAAIGVGAAATLGAVVLGPVGFLVGAASVGIGMGIMQIPEEQRDNVRKHASTSLEKARDIACELNDTMSTNCARYTGTDPNDIAERVGKAMPEEIVDHCYCYPGQGEDGGSSANNNNNLFRTERGGEAGGGGGGYRHRVGSAGDNDGHSLSEIRSEGSSPLANAVTGVERGMNRLVGDVFGSENEHHHSPLSQQVNLVGGGGGGGRGGATGGGVDGTTTAENEDGGRRVACGRKGRVVPLSQIHSLRPSLQPRAWLDVMASAHTTREEKNEAMQEILILAKDKEISRWFLEEGILDSLMYILSSYFRNYSSYLRDETPGMEVEPFSAFQKGGIAFYHARLAANCCVALGKAHCAAIHTEGDLLLMSAYSRGSVPVERQLAQMLFEVPHHMKVIPPCNVGAGENTQDVEFTLTELSMQQAEDLASSIKALDDGEIDV